MQMYTNADLACSRVYTVPETRLLQAKIPSPSLSPSVKRLGDKTKPNAKEKAALEAMGDLMSTCHSLQDPLKRDDYPVTYPAYANQAQRTRALLASLWSGQITFGQYNAGTQEIQAAFEAEKTSLLQQQAIVEAQQRTANAAKSAQYAIERAEERAFKQCLAYSKTKREKQSCY